MPFNLGMFKDLMATLIHKNGVLNAEEAGRLFRQYELLMDHPIVGVTHNGGMVVRAVVPDGNPMHGKGGFWVACNEVRDHGEVWVTWNMMRRPDVPGGWAYDAGNYFHDKDAKSRALADLAMRSTSHSELAYRISMEVDRYWEPNFPGTSITKPEDHRMAQRLRKWAKR